MINLQKKVDSSILADLNNNYCSDFIIDPVKVSNRLAITNIFKAPGPDGLPNLAPLLKSTPVAELQGCGLCLDSTETQFSAVLGLVLTDSILQGDSRMFSRLPTTANTATAVTHDWPWVVKISLTLNYNDYKELKSFWMSSKDCLVNRLSLYTITNLSWSNGLCVYVLSQHVRPSVDLCYLQSSEKIPMLFTFA